MPLLEDGRLRPDPFVTVTDEEPLPEGTPAIISLARLLRDAPAGRNAPLGVALAPEEDPRALVPFLGRLSLVAVRLPKHRDGRAFTQARALREALGFRGEVRATGHVLPDQYAFLLRCGVTVVELPEGADPAIWNAARQAHPVAYQAAVAGDAEPLGFLRRHVTA